MNRITKALLLITMGLTLLIPFASTYPDDLEKIIKSLGVEEPVPIWSGLIPDFSLSIIGNSYVATVISGLIGLFSVLAVAWIIGWASLRRNRV